MSLRNLVERNLVSCSPDTPIRRAAELMESKDVGALLVIEDGKPVGIATDRDIAIRCVSHGMNCESAPISEIMSEAVETVSAEQGIFDVIQLMKKKEIRRVPVIDETGQAIGLLSFGDLFQLIGKELGDLMSLTSPQKPKLVEQAA